jgi:RimJ/RimL family protein N-acetyltransferase
MRIIQRAGRLPVLQTKRLVLRDITPADITPAYVAWLNNPEVNRYLEVRFQAQTPESVRDYVLARLADIRGSAHFGVYDQEGTRLVGTATLPVIRRAHGSAEVSFVIGHPEAGGRGYATEAVHALCWYAFRMDGLAKLWGGYYDGHEGSHKVFAKNGFRIEGRIVKELVDWRGERVDHVIEGLLAEDYAPDERLLGALPPEMVREG